MKNKIFILALIAIGVLGFLFFKSKALDTSQETTAQPAGLQENFVRPHSPTFGNPMARATVIEWFDPECESCRMIHPAFKQMINEYKDRAHFVLRYMPYHANSMFAASALEEAKELGKFEQALDVLFETQPEWGDHHQPKPELIVTYLSKIGIPRDKLDKDYLIKKHGDKIKLDAEDGEKVGVRGTPSFFINGQPLRQLDEESLRAAIESAIR